MFKGDTYYTIGDFKNPSYKSKLFSNKSLKDIEAKVVASFAKGDKTGFYKFLAIGSGTSDLFVDDDNPPLTEDIVENNLNFQNSPRLFSEFFRKEVSQTMFVDLSISGDNKFVDFNTGVVEFIWTIGNNEAVGTWKEVGIFAGNATKETNSGDLVHYQTLNSINKTPSSLLKKDLNWHWRIDFRKI